jgi:DNA modification methylase
MESIHLVVTSPPYSFARSVKEGDKKIIDNKEVIEEIIKEVERLTKEDRF